MDLTPTTLSYDEEFKGRLDTEEQLVQVTRLCLDLVNKANLEPAEDADEEVKKIYEELKESRKLVEKKNNNLAEAVAKKNEKYEASKELRLTRLDEIYIPPCAEQNSQHFKITDVIHAVGKIGNERPIPMRLFLESLFQLGANLDFSENNYRTSLSACFEGELKSQFMSLKGEPFEEMIRWFDNVYHTPDDFSKYDESLANFERYADEPLRIFMKRYALLAKQADRLLPTEHKWYTTLIHRHNILHLATQEPARAVFGKWKNRTFNGGFTDQIDRCIEQAQEFEEVYNCVPRKSLIVSKQQAANAYKSYAQLNEVDFEEDEWEDVEAHPAQFHRERRERSRNAAMPYNTSVLKKTDWATDSNLKPIPLPAPTQP